jgi:hypothetical protein
MNGSFENQWRNALKDAEENPPIDIWGKIVEKLDQELIADLTLKNTLLAAVEMPDDSVWANIEKALDEEKERKPFILIWFNKYAATGIAALLLFALSFSLFNNGFNEIENKVGLNSPKKAYDESRMDANLDLNLETENKSLIAIEKPVSITESPNQLNAKPVESLSMAAKLEQAESEVEIEIIDFIHSSLSSLELLLNKEVYRYGNRFNNIRKKLSFETPQEYLVDNSNFLKRSWFGIISGISPFDPNLKINNFERAVVLSSNNNPQTGFQFNNLGETADDPKQQKFAIPLSQPYNNVKPGSSVNLGFDYGKRIRKHFSIESGVRYLAGNSAITSNVYSINQRTGDIRSFLESNYISKNITSFDNTVIVSLGDIDNEYKYIIVPLQIGYHVPLTKKIEASFLVGVSGDMIINNVFDNLSEGGSKLNASKSAYKAINLSGLGGLKVNYRVHQNWQLSVGSNIQQTLTSGVEKSEGFSFKPRYLGINYGVNYQFN